MINNAINNLKRKRYIFHSEADLQFALGWELGSLIPILKIRFEQPHKDQSIDILYYYNDDIIAVELKYKTALLKITHDDENFKLKDHAAIDTGRFDVLKDISRVESIIQSGFATKGYVLFITNCSSYWRNTPYKGSQNTNDNEFRLENGRIIHGSLMWPSEAKITTYGKERIKGLTINGNYLVNWEPYSNFEGLKNGEFKYLLFEIQFK